jgi:site-specific recombinase XerD
MSNKVVPHTNNQLAPVESFYEYAQAQNASAKRGLFAEYREKKSQSTLYAHDKDLGLFVDFVHSSGGIVFNEDIPHTHNAKGDGCPCQRCRLARGLRDFAEAWTDVSHGMVFNFRDWLKEQGYSIKSINRRLSTIKIYAALAFQSGVLSESDHVYIRAIKGYTSKDGKKIDEKRERSRISSKKAQPTEIPEAMVRCLKYDHDFQTAQGIRDALMMTMLLDTGMRCSELEAFKVENIRTLAPMPDYEDFQTDDEYQAAIESAAARSIIQFYRLKTSEWSKPLAMTPDLFVMVRKYADAGLMPENEKAPLLRSSHRSGKLKSPGMSSRAIYSRVQALAKQCGIENVSPHDFRHSAAKRTAKATGGDITRLMAMLGWSTPSMATHYAEMTGIANEGVGQI